VSAPTEPPAVLGWLTEWHTLADEERVVLSPENDLIDHDPTGDCVCGPYIEHLGGKDWLYMHASLDGREKLEGG
jgi:hypothetical protein